jgi:hypothetical protein
MFLNIPCPQISTNDRVYISRLNTLISNSLAAIFLPVVVILSLVLISSLSSANPATKHAEFIDLIDENHSNALEILQSVIADPTIPGAAAILRSAILSGSPSARDSVASVASGLPMLSRLAVHGAFADLGDKRLESDLLAIAESADADIHQLIIPMFSGAGTADSLPFLLAQMEQGNAAFANMVASVIVRMELPQLDDRLLRMITTGERQERLQAIRLASIRNPSGTEALLISILKDTEDNDGMKSAVLSALERVGTTDSGSFLLKLIANAENAASARPYQATFRRLTPRLEGEIDYLWTGAFLPIWSSVESTEIRHALLQMVPSLRSKESGEFLIHLMRTDDDLRNAALAQFRSWNQWLAADYVLQAVILETLSESQKNEVFNMGIALISPRIKVGQAQKQNFANRLRQAAPNSGIQERIEAAMIDAKLSL